MIKFQFIGLWNEFLFPAIVIYTLMQEQMISGLTSGALKG
jgi:ABC-type glycerol-3-phosphate transport system permease component